MQTAYFSQILDNFTSNSLKYHPTGAALTGSNKWWVPYWGYLGYDSVGSLCGYISNTQPQILGLHGVITQKTAI